jgi:SNF2 family DNA or RNA helicase
MQRIERKTFRVLKKDCLDLPDLVVQELEVELSKEQELAYKEMKDNFIAWVTTELKKDQPHAVVARLAITKALRLQQIVSGFVKTDDGEILRFKDVPRISALRDQLDILTKNSKVIVWACFHENYAMIADVCKELGIKYVEIHGDIRDKAGAAKQFETDPETRVLIGNQGAGGVGINLVAASYSIYYSRNFKLGDDIQSEARNHRQGSQQHEKITRFNMVATGTIDEDVSKALSTKQDISETILDFAINKLGGKNERTI